MCSVEVSDGSTDCSFQLQDSQIALTLFVSRNGFLVGNDLHLELMIVNNALNCLQIEPDIVCIEVFELFDTLELLDVVRWDLGNFQKTDGTLIVDDGTTLDICLCFVGQFHNVLSLSFDHVVEDVHVDNGTEVVDVADKDVFLSASDHGVEGAAVDKGIKDISMSRRIPGLNWGIVLAGDGEKRVFVDSGKAGLVESDDVDVVALVLLNDALGVVFSVEGVHEGERDVTAICTIEVLTGRQTAIPYPPEKTGLQDLTNYLNLPNRQVEERVSLSDFNDGLWTDATHACAETAVEFKDDEFVQVGSALDFWNVVIGHDLLGIGWMDSVPFARSGQKKIDKLRPRGRVGLCAYISLPFALSLR